LRKKDEGIHIISQCYNVLQFHMYKSCVVYQKLDVLQVLAERNERKKHELELNGLPSESNDSLSIAPNFSGY